MFEIRLEENNIPSEGVVHEDTFVLLGLLLMPRDNIQCFHLAFYASVISGTFIHSSSSLMNKHEGAWSASL